MANVSEHFDADFLLSLSSFCRKLRQRKVNVTLDQEIDCYRALRFIDVSNYDDFHATLRTILLSKAEDFPVFDELFVTHWASFDPDQYKRIPSDQSLGNEFPQETAASGKREGEKNTSSKRSDPSPEKDGATSQEEMRYSSTEVLEKKDFAAYTDDDLEEIRKAVCLIVQKIKICESRRKNAFAAEKEIFDLRRTLRKTIHLGGNPIRLMWKSRDVSKARIIILCDISGSMEQYSRSFVQFLYSMQKSLDTVETFVFGTRLNRISAALRRGRSLNQALNAVSKVVLDWSGGTRIGECLDTFNKAYAPLLLGRKAVVIVISDGWDRGDPELLAKEMSRMRRNSHYLIWLNPLLSSPRYEPSCMGMKTALPFLDQFLPFYNLRSIIQLGNVLCKIGEKSACRSCLKYP